VSQFVQYTGVPVCPVQWCPSLSSTVVSQFVQYSGVPVCPVQWCPSLSSTLVSQFVQCSGVPVCPVQWCPSLSSTEHTQASALSLSHSCKIDRIQVATLEQGNTEQVSGFKASCHSKCSKSKAIHGVNCTRPPSIPISGRKARNFVWCMTNLIVTLSPVWNIQEFLYPSIWHHPNSELVNLVKLSKFCSFTSLRVLNAA